MENRNNALSRRDSALLGHATTRDFKNFNYLGSVLYPGKKDSDWDSGSIWSGSIMSAGENDYYLYYSSVAIEDKRTINRIGLAKTDDLSTFRKSKTTVISADPRFYETIDTLNNESETLVSFRDPFVYYSEKDDYYYMLICARTNEDPSLERGCIGFAKSKDLTQWEQLPPIYAPDLFLQMEAPNLYKKNGQYYLMFSLEEKCFSAKALKEVPLSKKGIYYIKLQDGLPTEKTHISKDTPIYLLAKDLYTGQIQDMDNGQALLTTWTNDLAISTVPVMQNEDKLLNVEKKQDAFLNTSKIVLSAA